MEPLIRDRLDEAGHGLRESAESWAGIVDACLCGWRHHVAVAVHATVSDATDHSPASRARSPGSTRASDSTDTATSYGAQESNPTNDRPGRKRKVSGPAGAVSGS